MEDKTQGVKSLVEFKKVIVEFRDRINGFVEELSKLLNDIEIPDEEEDTWEMKCPYKNKDVYWFIHNNVVEWEYWEDTKLDKERFEAGNTFSTEKAALLEAKRRNLLTRFRAFRDECNGDWKPDWNDIDQKKYIIRCEETDLYYVVAYCTLNGFNLFGYFKNEQDAQRAIELFCDEIKTLFVDCEGD